ncbi:MAG: glycosyltransferase family 9 protein [Acidobacteria bacterium]|nr:glycosyltransferase family 9 protein [Acidobacteriota bacterium]
MGSAIDQLAKGAHIAVIRLRSLGDCVLTTPAIALLKRHRPDLRTAVVIEPTFADLLANNPAVDDVLPPSISALRNFCPRLALNLHGGTRSMILTALSGARYRAGFAHHRYSSIYNVPIPRAQQILGEERKVHTAEHLASAMFHLGVPCGEIPRAQLFAAPMHSAHPYAVIHAMASAPDKAWPTDRFIELGYHLSLDCRIEPVFIGAPSDDLTPFKAFRTATPRLADTMRLIAGASLFVGNDSGPAHMAAAMAVPMVVLFAASDPVVWGPWKTKAETIIAPGGMSCVPARQVTDAVARVRAESIQS